MSSGVGVNQECLDLFQQLKLKHNLKFIIFKLSDDCKEIVVEKSSEDPEYDSFVKSLPEDDCRYAVCDFCYTSEEGGQRNKICFFKWAPDAAKIKSKMLYASSESGFKKSLNGIAVEIQGTDYSEVDREHVLDKVSRGKY